MSAAITRFALARVTIELKTAFRVSGGEDTGSAWDQEFVTDANGVPAIPGSTLAGVLRHAYAGWKGEDPDADGSITSALFGYQAADHGRPSRVHVSWAQALDSSTKVLPFRAEAQRLKDPVVERLTRGALRDHVRIDHRGVADDRGKYDELVVPAGARFRFELRVDAQDKAEEVLSTLKGLLNLLHGPATRIGGATRRGLGAFEVVGDPGTLVVNLADKRSRQDFAKLPSDLAATEPTGLLKAVKLEATDGAYVAATLLLEPDDYYLFGGGTPYRPEHQITKKRVQNEKKVDNQKAVVVKEQDYVNRVPVEEDRITWPGNGRSAVEPKGLIPGSSVKGAITHRTAYHDRRSSGVRVQPGDPLGATVLRSEGLAILFGDLKTAPSADDEPLANAGCVFIDDAVPAGSTFGRLQHVSLDRFTQGPMDGLLFGEAPNHGGLLQLKLTIDTARGERVKAPIRRALADALDDLVNRRLPLGAAGSRGFGWFTGKVTWTDDGAWIRGGEE